MDDKTERRTIQNRESQRRYNQRHPDANALRAAEFRKNNPEKIKATLARMLERRRELIHNAKSVPCTDCGHTYPPYVMDFDHVRGDKLNHVSQLRRIKLSTIQEEIDKCDVVCANCHRERTHQQGFC